MRLLTVTTQAAAVLFCIATISTHAAIHHGIPTANRHRIENNTIGLPCANLRKAVWKEGHAMAVVQLPAIVISASGAGSAKNYSVLNIHAAARRSFQNCGSLYRVSGIPGDLIVKATLPMITIRPSYAAKAKDCCLDVIQPKEAISYDENYGFIRILLNLIGLGRLA